jgi:ABC-type phosphate transport system substrate-binding protein
MNLLKTLRATLIGTVLGLSAQASMAELVVVVSAKNPLAALTENQVANIFLGRSSFPMSGEDAVPVDLAEDSAVRAEFYRQVTGKSGAQLKAYWSKLIFTGRAQPPREVPDAAALKKLLDSKPAAVGYLDKNDVDASVKVVLPLH